MTPFSVQILYALQSLFTPLGILAVSAFLLLLILALIFKPLKWLVFGLMLFASTLGLHDINSPSLMFPLEQLRSQGRLMTSALMFIVMVSLLVLPKGWRRKYFVPGLAMYLVFQLILSLNLTIRNDFARGAGGILLNLFTFFLFAIAIPHALQSWNNVISYLRGIAGFGVIFAGINLLQILVKPSAVSASRFFGTTDNPQFVGQICALGLLPVCYMLVRPGKARWERLIYGPTAALLIIMLTWSGSRTGVLMAILGLALLFRARLNRLAIAGVVIAFFAIFVSKVVFPEKQVISSHLFDTANTRAAVWTNLLNQFLSSPVVGTMKSADFGYGESSYLSVGSNIGLMGLIPFGVALGLIAWSINKLRRLRPIFADTLLVDLVIASLVTCAFGGIFESYLLGILSVTLMLGMAYMPILAYLLESAEVPEVVAEEHTAAETAIANAPIAAL